MGGIRYSVASYCRSEKTDDSFIIIQREAKGRIEKIILLNEDAKVSLILLLREIIVDENPIFKDEYAKHYPLRKIS